MTRETFADLSELSQRGRVFSEMFPGTTAGDAWRAAFDSAHPRGKEHEERLAGEAGQAGLMKGDREK